MDQITVLDPSAVAVVTVGERGPPGPAGASGNGTTSVGTFAAAVNLLRGGMIAISRSTGQAIAANAAVYAQSFVTGYAFADTLAGFPVDVYRGPVTRTDWTPLAGAVSLAVGVTYFLAPGGGITVTTPTTGTSQASLVVGVALTTQTLLVDPKQPFLL